MSNDSYYPDFDLGMLRPFQSALSQMLNDPLWLERAECPYPPEVVEEMRSIWVTFRAKDTTPARAQVSQSDDKWGDLSAEMISLYDDLRNFSATVPAEDAKEKMTVFRTATALLDKIVGLQERAQNVKAVSDFQRRVYEAFDQVLSPDQRTRAMEILSA